MKEDFFAIVQSISPLTPEAIATLGSYLALVHCPKQTLLVREGTVSDKLYFIKKGAARAYYHHQDKEYTDWFVFEHMFMCSILAFFGRQPSAQTIETLEPCELLVISREQMYQVADKHPDVQKFCRIILEQSLVILQQNVIDQRFKTAQERYQQLVNVYPQAIQRVPLKYIASFLGVTQETLSRIRAAII
jgi:CRP-like cAMP-binding protein